MPVAVDEETSRQRLLGSLTGQDLHIPDLQPLLSSWPQYVSPQLERLKKDVDEKLESLFPPGKRLHKMKAADAALFGASWWPYASFDKLRIATYLSIWLFAWDDETDSTEFSSLASNMQKAQTFRAETVEYARKCLLHEGYLQESKTPSNSIIASFKPIGNALSKSCTTNQIVTFYNELLFFVDMTSVEQQYQMSQKLPTVEGYRQRRMGSSAVGICLAITEYCMDFEIPPNVMTDDDMKLIWDETNIIISTVNDVLSFRKEITQGQVDSLIPLLYSEHGDLGAAMDDAVGILKNSIAVFETASQRLLDFYSYDKEIHLGIQKFIHACQCACTANLNWSLTSGRYKLGSRSLTGDIVVHL